MVSRKYKIAASALLLLAVVVAAALFLQDKNVAVLSSQGPIADKERRLLLVTSLMTLLVVIPVFVMTFGIVWKYRENNSRITKYSPDWDHNLAIESVWWLIPTLLILVLAGITWRSSHQLDPFRPLASKQKPINIEVVALQWKWLFIYPEQNIASVNYLEFPVNTPINFMITADAPMNSFWIPQLGGQIYAMPGMTTQLHLMASKIGNFRGSSANLSGEGFSGMNFVAHAATNTDFKTWTTSVRNAKPQLDTVSYNELMSPSDNNQVVYYRSVEAGLYDSIQMKYMMPGGDMPTISGVVSSGAP